MKASDNALTTAVLAHQRDIERKHLFPFVWSAFKILQPAEAFLPAAPYMQAMCHAAEMTFNGGPKRLIITVPPRHGKSICISDCLPERSPRSGLQKFFPSASGNVATSSIEAPPLRPAPHGRQRQRYRADLAGDPAMARR